MTISGTAEQGQTLSASHTLADADGLGTVTLTWLRDGVPTGVSGASYAVTAADAGHAVSVRADYVDGGGQAESVVSGAMLAPPAPAVPAPVGAGRSSSSRAHPGSRSTAPSARSR